MKGTIVKCLEEMIVAKFGKDKWKEIAQQSGTKIGNTIIMPIANVEDGAVLKVVQSACQVLNITLEQAADAFGDFWMTVYAPRCYPSFLQQKNAREFLTHMDDVHVQMTRAMKDAHPPRFEFKWNDERTLVIEYQSSRGLIDFAVGLCRGAGHFFKEDLQVRKLSDTRIEVVFPA